MEASGRRGTLRRFIIAAAISLIPVLLLGFVLAASYRSEARRRGLAEGRSEAQIIAQTAIEPLLGTQPVTRRLDGGRDNGPADRALYRALLRVTTRAVGDHHVLRLRLRTLAGNVVFSDDRSGFTERPEGEALDAARGTLVARLTRMNSDSNDQGPAGHSAVEAYVPLLAGASEQRVGVLELYLPYAPIAADVSSGMNRLSRDLVLGLGALYVLLFAISWSVSRGLRRQVAVNAFLAEYDALTALPNRRYFRNQVAASLARARDSGRSIAIATIDLDRFKDVNNCLGHGNGDALLVELAQRLRKLLHDRDVLGRLGGDEFGLVLEVPGDAEAVLSELRDSIGHEVQVSGVPVTLEASIGFVIAPEDGDDVDELLQRADVAMHLAKQQHSGVVRYDPELDHYDPTNLTLITELRHAIDAGELVLHYQPQARFAGGRYESVEALVRWQHPQRGLLQPDAFLPLAEQTDLIDRLTDWVLVRALTDIRDLHESEEMGVAVNVSARSLGRPDFPERVIKALGDVGVAPSRLTIEITETALMLDPARSAIALSRLDAFGVNISLDDFGTGQTSLGYLSSLPVDELKIDKMFVSDLLEDATHAAIVRSIIDLGHNLGLRVVAEGIETTAVLHALQDFGCDIAQGFRLARPMLPDDLPRFLALMRSSRVASRG